ncbi:MAG: NAD(P)H-hydrate dehydratase [Oxalicibacterium faecigallinarum]|uniref:NAD(P)H-hydrate dehydratase n=1 Tax=Oxalicibacterium faecigallinarum TaxID=573741 RepID=UPI00280A1247|nr:NAD(P)H-hydrate dehydratase [Oxalicibacterium faecigallinarum]MDQ7968879.1 NAD(P)H-hydrate dehydratase [Oxalicibacterium faecigallinarum]
MSANLPLIQVLDTKLLQAWPLPVPSPDGDKEDRGHVLIIGGSHQMPGAVILAATAALRAGAGKLTVATGQSVAQLIASALPESRVIGLPETEAGGIPPHCVDALQPLAKRNIDAILVGPGMQDEAAIATFVRALMPVFPEAKIVLDACAMSVVRGSQSYQEDAENTGPTRLILTPHAGEMARLLGEDKTAIRSAPHTAARDAAKNWNAVVALKGAMTCIASPNGQLWQHDGDNIGLASSGSGDVLAGVIAGLAARGAGVEQATAWGVMLHARAGQQLAERIGPLGFLAREIADDIPAALRWFEQATST